MMPSPSRRQMLAAAAMLTVGAGGAVAANAEEAVKETSSLEPFGYCLNTSTISGQNLPLGEEVEIAAKAGFGAVEPWIREIEKHGQSGKSLADLRKQIADLGLKVPSAIGFAQWIVDDDAKRSAGLEQMKRDMDLVAQIGGTRIAAPPVGANGKNDPSPDLATVAQRYRAVLELGKQMGVTPELEIWGPSKTLSKLAEAAYVAVAAGSPDAVLLLDVFHLYKGNSDLGGLALLRGSDLAVLHMNDYPASPAREQINDSFRVYPGDGVAPLASLFRTLRDIGFRGFLSVELFNKEYWKQSPQKVAQAAIDKTRAAVRKALG